MEAGASRNRGWYGSTLVRLCVEHCHRDFQAASILQVGLILVQPHGAEWE
jgi:hypothetical protein